MCRCRVHPARGGIRCKRGVTPNRASCNRRNLGELHEYALDTKPRSRSGGTYAPVMLIAHADWGVDVKKQWVAHGRLGPDGRWRAFSPKQVAADGSLLQRLHIESTTDPIVLGFDFPIGLPRAYAARAGIEHFPAFLTESDHGPWRDFFAVADAPEEISLRRPFYPNSAVPKGTRRRSQLEEALGLEYAALLRRCERAQPGRAEACSLFWTLGGNQVGKGALAGWRLLRAERPGALSYWPFDGALDELVGPGRVVVTETYPAEFSHHIGVGRVSGKRHQVVRRSHAEALLLFAEQAGIELDPELEQTIDGGFGPSKAGEDPFDAVIGLFGMINVVMGRRPANDPDDEAVRSVEGWILGQAALTAEVDRHRRPAAAAVMAATDRDLARSLPAEVDEYDHPSMTFEEVVRKRRMIHAF